MNYRNDDSAIRPEDFQRRTPLAAQLQRCWQGDRSHEAPEWLFLVEDNEVVDHLVNMGLYAGNCSQEWDELRPFLIGHDHVGLLIGREAGEAARAAKLAELIYGVGLDVRIVTLTKLPATAAELLELTDRAKSHHVGPLTFRELAAQHPTLNPPVIDGLARVGETMNVVAQSKVGKSWLMYQLDLCVATGRTWLGFPVPVAGKVLHVDNELHAPTLAYRIPKVARAMGITTDEYADNLHIHCLRGRLVDLYSMRQFFDQFKPGEYRLCVIDAWYRMLPPGTDENSNGEIAAMYNLLDQFAERMQCTFAVVHHSSKGSQGQKTVVDVGSGAGSQSRAADAHLVIRQHQTDGAVVLDAVNRSFAPITPICLRWDYPLWHPAPDLDPKELKTDRKARTAKVKEDKPEKLVWTNEMFASEVVGTEARTIAVIMSAAEEMGLSIAKAKRHLQAAVELGIVHRINRGAQTAPLFTTRTPTLTDLAPESGGAKCQ